MSEQTARPSEPGSRPRRSAFLPEIDELAHKATMEAVEHQVGRVLAEQLIAAGPTAELAHMLLASIIAVVGWGTVPTLALVLWLVVVVWATVVAGLVRQRLARHLDTPDYVRTSMRRSVLVHGLAWGSGAAVVAPSLPFPDVALMMVIFSGLVAGATATLVADQRSFYWYTAAVVAPLSLGILFSGTDRPQLVAVVLLALFTGTMVILYQRSHALLATNVRSAKRLELRERSVTREQGFLDALLASVPSGIVTIDEGGTIRGVNPGFEHLFGYSRHEVHGKDLIELVVPAAEQEAARGRHAQTRAGETVVVEADRLRKDRTLVPVRIAAARVEDDPEGTTIVLFDDVTEMKQAERALRDAEQQYRELVESASDLVWQVDAQGTWTFLNAACQRIYGLSVNQLVGKPFANMVNPAHRESDLETFRRVLEGAVLTDYETIHLDAAGQRKHLSFAAKPMLDATGAVVGAHGTARDVTERAAVTEALQAAREQAEQATQAKAGFLATMSHEIRTPMNGVLGMVDLLVETELNPEQQRWVELIRVSAESLLRILNDILDFSKIETGNLQLDQTAFDVTRLVDSTVRLLAVRAFERHVEIAYDVRPDVPTQVRGDPSRLRQVLTNLIGNAIKFTHQGEVEVTVSQEATRDSEALLRFAVRDTGIGIPPEKVELIFEEFRQADVSTARKYGGTGLGLTISRQLVALMGGKLQVESEVDKGTTFFFTVPFPVESTKPAAIPGLSEVSFEGMRTLVVDDNPTNRRIVGGLLSPAGALIHEAGNSDEALEHLYRSKHAGRPYELAIIDGWMPGRDGFELASVMKNDVQLAETRIMMLTSAGQRGDGQRCRQLGIRAYLTKPVSRSELIESVAAVITGQEHVAGDTLITRHSMAEARRHLRILLAEDNVVNQQVAMTILQKRGHTVDVVENGRLAVEAVERTRYDAVLMDIQMPEMDGLTATSHIRRDPAHADLPIIAMTAHATLDERERFLAGGMTEHLAKPFKPQDLLQVVEGLGAQTPESEEPAAPTVTTAPVDLVGFRQEMRDAGIEDSVENILDVFLEDAPGRLSDLEKAVQAQHAHEIRAAAHAFKSAAGTVRAQHLAALLKQTEAAGESGEIEEAAELCSQVHDEYHNVIAYLRRAHST
jgi:PAS domain S-box-containing protein